MREPRGAPKRTLVMIPSFSIVSHCDMNCFSTSSGVLAPSFTSGCCDASYTVATSDRVTSPDLSLSSTSNACRMIVRLRLLSFPWKHVAYVAHITHTQSRHT